MMIPFVLIRQETERMVTSNSEGNVGIGNTGDPSARPRQLVDSAKITSIEGSGTIEQEEFNF